MASKKNAEAYQVKRSAVKKTQKEKRGIANKRHVSPQMTVSLGLRFKINNAKTTKKAMS